MNGTRAQKKAKHEKGDEGENGAAFSMTFKCPITHKLFTDPHTAEDGRIYEKEAIQNWLKSKKQSPVTKEPMGTSLVPSPTMRAIVASAIKNKLVDADAAREWHLESAKAEALVLPPGSMSVSIEDHLRRAEEISSLSSSEEIEIMRAATDLKGRKDDLILEMRTRTEDLEKEAKALVDKSPKSVSEAVAAILEYRHKILEWRELRVGKSKIRVIDDAEELERLCKRKAPGARSDCAWDERKKDLCGKVFVVERNWSDVRAYKISSFWYIPFDACYLVEY